MSRQKIYRSLFLLALLVVFCAGFLVWFQLYQKMTEVIFLNVGQGDAILISQGSNQLLIDGGRSGKDLLARVGRRVPFWDRTIETVIATHPDGDHIGGFGALLSAYDVQTFLYTGAEGDTEVSRSLQQALVEKQVDTLKIFRGGSVKFPSGGELFVEYPLSPLPSDMKDTNAGSIVGRFTFGTTEMLLTGDLANEETVLPDIRPAEILKAAHHGSKYSTSAAFLDKVKPREVVVSVGKNSYGHPSPEVLARLAERGISIQRTDLKGDIRYRCVRELARCVLVP
jgi:competence protein ComEC